MDLRIKGQSILGLLRHAKDILFNNTGTTLTSTNVEDAIKEISGNLSDIVKVVQHSSGTLSLNLNSGQFSAQQIPTGLTGYTPIGIVGIIKSGSGDASVAFTQFTLLTGYAQVVLVNTGSSSATITEIKVNVLYKKNV